MATKLTKKQDIFVDAFIETGVGAQAAKEAYDIDPNAHALAASIASENLTKPDIQEAIVERNKQKKELVDEAHDSLLKAVRLDYFVFPKSMSDEEITTHVAAQGLTVLNVRPSDKGKLAFFSLPDGASRGKGIELFHKVEGTFAPEKRLNLNVELEATPEVKEATRVLNEHFRRNNIASDGGPAGSVGTEASD